jgi:hypothetical protein
MEEADNNNTNDIENVTIDDQQPNEMCMEQYGPNVMCYI